jgi:hypothetical protein
VRENYAKPGLCKGYSKQLSENKFVFLTKYLRKFLIILMGLRSFHEM